jgi:hypothetical protein
MADIVKPKVLAEEEEQVRTGMRMGSQGCLREEFLCVHAFAW